MDRSVLGRGELIQILREKKAKVDELIFRWLPQSHETKELDLLNRMMRDYPGRGGKGLRGTLCLLTCQALGREEEEALPTAAALEIFQSWILIRDDIEDMSEERRGEPTLHERYGVPLAINASDALYARMWDLLLTNRSVLGDEKTFELLNEFTRMTIHTTEGQHIELSWVNDDRWDLSEEDYYAMCRKKTSWYTCITPLRLGGVIGGADQKLMDAFIPFGMDLGVAFQIQDDVLNLIGEEEKYGKEIGGDIWEGKRTLITLHLLRSVDPEESREILNTLSKKREEKTEADVRRVLEFMKSYDSVAYAKAVAKKLSEKARGYFEHRLKALPEGEAKTVLRGIVDFVVEREL